MAVLTDPRYITLAAIAAQGLGAGPKVGQAILAQFACEKSGEWPPKDNNPGNVHVGPMAQVGWNLPHGSGDGGACALFPSPESGASGYAAYIGHHVLYPAARQAIARDDANAYIAAVTGVDYGTNRSCWQQNYDRLAKAGGGGRSVGGSYADISAEAGALAVILGKSPADKLTKSDIDTLYRWAKDHNTLAGLPDPLGLGATTLHALLDGQVGKPLTDVQPDLYRGLLGAVAATTPGGQGATAAADAAGVAGDAIAAAIGAVVPLVVGGLVLVVAAALLLGGTRDALGA